MDTYKRVFCVLVTIVLSCLINTNAEFNPVVVQYSRKDYINMTVVLENLPEEVENAVFFYKFQSGKTSLEGNKKHHGKITLIIKKSIKELTDVNSTGENIQLFTQVHKNYSSCGDETLIALFVYNQTLEGSNYTCKHNCLDVDKGCIIHMSWEFDCQSKNVKYLNDPSNYFNCIDKLESGALQITDPNWPLLIGVPAAAIVVLSALIWCIIKTARKICTARRGNNNTLDVAVYSTVNEIQYAEIVPLAKRSNNIRGLDNLTPYAEIMGVLEPKPVNSRPIKRSGMQ